MNKEEIENIKCAICKKNITSISQGFGDKEIEVITHFDISRSNKEFEINDNCIEEIQEERNEKMLMTLCEECFLKVLNESKTLGELFLNEEKGTFIY